MQIKKFNVSLPFELVKILDRQSVKSFSTRSEYIKRAIIEKLTEDGALEGYDIERTHGEVQRDRLKKFIDEEFMKDVL